MARRRIDTGRARRRGRSLFLGALGVATLACQPTLPGAPTTTTVPTTTTTARAVAPSTTVPPGASSPLFSTEASPVPLTPLQESTRSRRLDFVSVSPASVLAAIVTGSPAIPSPRDCRLLTPKQGVQIEVGGERIGFRGVEARICNPAAPGSSGSGPYVSWYGHVGPARSLRSVAMVAVTLDRRGRPLEVTGFVQHGSRVFEVMPAEGATHTVSEISEGRLVPQDQEDEDDLVDPSSEPLATSPVAPTPVTAEAKQGQNAVVELLVAATGELTTHDAYLFQVSKIEKANLTFIDSAMPVRIRGAGPIMTGYRPGTISVDLGRLARRGDGHLDGLRQRFEADGFDVLALLRAHGDGKACGMAPLMTSASGNRRPYLEVGATRCGPHTLTHELGHSMSARHDPPSSPPGPSHPYAAAFGHFRPGLARDVMSYSKPCGTDTCPSSAQFADPNRDFIGQPGVPSGTAGRNAARAISLAAPAVSRQGIRPKGA